jgi:hypothetical protein
MIINILPALLVPQDPKDAEVIKATGAAGDLKAVRDLQVPQAQLVQRVPQELLAQQADQEVPLAQRV